MRAIQHIGFCAAMLFAQGAVAQNTVMDNPSIQYSYTYQKRGPRHFCDFATLMSKAPLAIKLTAAFIFDDTKPKDKNVTTAYIVEAFVARMGQNSQLETTPIKVVSARIISDVFHSDLHAIQNVSKDVSASYTIPSEGSLALFTNVMTVSGKYTLAVEFENHASIIVNVIPNEKILNASEKWMKCAIAVAEHGNIPK